MNSRANQLQMQKIALFVFSYGLFGMVLRRRRLLIIALCVE